MSDLEDSKYQMAEYRVSVYGRCAFWGWCPPALACVP
jgi:hypothetical protein